MTVPKGSLLVTYILLALVALDMAAPGYRRYLIIDQLKEGLYSVTTNPGGSPTPPPTTAGAPPTSSGGDLQVTPVACEQVNNAYRSDCNPYGHRGN